MANPTTIPDLSAKELFSKTQEKYLKLDDSPLPSAHPQVQENLGGLVEELGEVWKRAEGESLFSENELLKEVETSSLPVLLTQYYLADVHSRIMDKRLIHLAMANKKYRLFLDMCQSLGLIPSEQATDKVVEMMEKDRSYRVGLKKREITAKKQQRQLLEKRGELMRKRIMSTDNFDDDELEQQMSPEEIEHSRKIHISMLELAVLRVYGELSSIKQETEILRFAEKRKKEAETGAVPQRPVSKPNKSSGIQMFNIGENGAINPMGEAPTHLTTNNLPSGGGGGGGGGGCAHGCSHGHTGPQEVKSIQQERDPLGMGAVVQRYTSHPKEAGGLISYDKDGRPLGTSSGKTKREELKEKVFQPGWRQPTESLDEYCNRMMPHAITGGGNEPTDDDLDREAAEKEDKIERDDEDYLREKREWDEFKDHNPSGMGNRLRQG